MEKYHVSWEEIREKIEVLKEVLVHSDEKVYGIPGNGSAVSELMDNAVETPEKATILIGLVHQTGKTHDKWRGMFPEKEIVFLYNTQYEFHDTDFIFPWDKTTKKKQINEEISQN